MVGRFQTLVGRMTQMRYDLVASPITPDYIEQLEILSG